MKLKRNHIILSKSEIDLFDKIKSEDVKGVRKLLKDQRTRNKININCFNDKGLTPLFVAIDGDNISDVNRMIRILLKYGAQINIPKSNGKTVLYCACMFPYHPSVHRFEDSADVMNLLLKNGAEPNIREDLNRYTPLHIACIDNNVAVVKSLLLYNADVNCVDKSGETPLMHASRDNVTDRVEKVSLLLENNASVNLQNDDGHTALHIACQSLKHTAVEVLLRHGANPNTRDKTGSTPLHYACKRTCQESIQILLEYNADANCQDNDGNTPLHRLVQQRFVSVTKINCIQKLLERNANVNIKNINGETPLQCVFDTFDTYSDHSEKLAVIESLLKFGSNVNVQSRVLRVIGDTPLHIAVRHFDIKLVQIILNQNPDLHIFNNNQQTPLDLAKYFNNKQIIACIEEHVLKIRCQMYTFYCKTWCQDLMKIPNNTKLISLDKKRKRKNEAIFTAGEKNRSHECKMIKNNLYKNSKGYRYKHTE